MQKVTGKWLQTDLTNEILVEETKIAQNNFYFLKILDQDKSLEIFVMGKLIEIVKNFFYFLNIYFFRKLNVIKCKLFNQIRMLHILFNAMT